MAQWLADNVTEVVILGLWSNSLPMYSVLHVQREEDDPAQSARDVLNNWQDHIVAAMPNNYEVSGCRYTDHNEDEGATGELAVDGAKPTVGTNAGDSAPPNVAQLVHKRIAGHVGVRAGRFYLPPITQDLVDENGILSAGYVDDRNDDLVLFHDGLSGAGGNRLVVVHKRPPAALSPVSIVTSLAMDPKVATQRRRLRR